MRGQGQGLAGCRRGEQASRRQALILVPHQPLPEALDGCLHGLQKEAAAAEALVVGRVPGRAPGVLPGRGRHLLMDQAGQLTPHQELIDGEEALAQSLTLAPGTLVAGPPGGHQPVDPRARQPQQFPATQGMETGHEGRIRLPHPRPLAGGEGQQALVGPARYGAKARDDGGLGTGGHAELAAVAAVGVDAEALIIDHPGTLRTGRDAGLAAGLGGDGMNAAGGDDLGDHHRRGDRRWPLHPHGLPAGPLVG